MERALIIQEKYYSLSHPEVALVLNNLANAYEDLSKFNEQKKLLERALIIDEKYYGLDHSLVAVTLNNLANAYGNLGDAYQKKVLLERALTIKEKHYGLDHLNTAITLHNLANAYGDLGEIHQKKSLLERALTIKEKHYDLGHPMIAITLGSLASAYFELNQFEEARSAADRAYHSFLVHPDAGPQHPHTKMAKQNLDAINQHFSNPLFKQATSTAASSSSNGSLITPTSILQSEDSTAIGKQLRNAANQNNVELLSQLIKENKNLNINAQDNGQHQRSALHWAVLKEAIPCIKILLIAGANIHLLDKSSKTSLDYALESENVEVLGLLLLQRYQLSLETPFDFARLLRCAANKGEVKILWVLIEKMPGLIDMADTGKNKRTALHWAVIGNYEECVRLLLNAGAYVDVEDAMNKTTIDYAQLATTAPVIRELLNIQIVNANPRDNVQTYSL